MFDDDAFVCGYGAVEVVSAVQPTVNHAMRQAAQADLPFDLHNVIDANPYVFGQLGDGPLLHRTVRFDGGIVTDLLGQSTEVGPGVGTVVGHAYGRVVIAFEGSDGLPFYLGWVNPEDFELAFVHLEASKCVH